MLHIEEKKISFGTTLILMFVILIVVTTSLIGYISFRNGQQAAKKLANQMQNSIQSSVENALNDFLAKPQALNQINADAIRSGLVDPRDLTSQRTHFLNQIQAFDSVTTCAFGSEIGEFTGAGRRSDGSFESGIVDKSLNNDYRVYLLNEQGELTEIVTVVPDYQPQERSWYQVAVEANGPTWSPIYVWATQSNIGISAVLPVYNNTRELLGVQLSSLSLEYIGQFLQNIRTINTGQIFILERTGLLVASSVSEPLLHEKRSGSEVLLERVSAMDSTSPLISETANYLNRQFTNIDQISSKQQMELEVEGQRYFLSVTPFADEYGLDWLIGIAISESNLMGAVEANTRATILVTQLSEK